MPWNSNTRAERSLYHITTVVKLSSLRHSGSDKELFRHFPAAACVWNNLQSFQMHRTDCCMTQFQSSAWESQWIVQRESDDSPRCMNTYTWKTDTGLCQRKGVRQGDTIFLNLFAACLEGLLRKLDCEKSEIRVSGEYLSYSRFADDVLFRPEKMHRRASTQTRQWVNEQ